MKKILWSMMIFLFVGCSTPVSKTELENLNGYWEIEKVTFANGETKNYKINTVIDYIELKNLKGFRKKMQPKFDGSYTTSNDTEFFSIVETDGSFELHYKTEMSEWEERILRISQNSFSVINEDTLTYTYKRFQPIKVNE
ncbi:hypothetical protein MNBD_BACTEROID03-330 [hydrothermal vent metagenome]|uniref:Lipocalin-like domain-containing protein n=1 Tax=hydrothermal vent metagenome TaxID=652676 RepID=A0A3B0THJ1_9ZZZZ